MCMEMVGKLRLALTNPGGVLRLSQMNFKSCRLCGDRMFFSRFVGCLLWERDYLERC